MTNYPWLDAYCCSKKGCEKDYKEEWSAFRYCLDGKMFALQGENKEGQKIITLKIEPSYGVLLRQDYPEITPGYYMNKVHWNSVSLTGSVPDQLLRDMVDESYAILFASLSKKRRLLINPESA